MFFGNVIIQIQTRDIKDHLGKENATISLMDWKIIMFDHEGVKLQKWVEVFQSSFHMSNLKIWSPKNFRLKGLTCITPINLRLLKIYSTIFLNEFLMCFFLQDLVYLRLILKSPQHYGKSRLHSTVLHKVLNIKIIINHFQN